jgi:hypothetical protein
VRSRCLFLIVASFVAIPVSVPKPPARNVQAMIDAYLVSASENGETLMECAKNGFRACCGVRGAALRRKVTIHNAVQAAKIGHCEAAAELAAETQCNNASAFSLILKHKQRVCAKLAAH